jgi:protein-L-isoaspartate(D-aspartate) O-methyltransferase
MMDFEQARAAMVECQIVARGIRSPKVVEVMRKVPRHVFVGAAFQEEAYADSPLPIGEGQTISQPYMVALMTDLLDVKPTNKLLEIGTGSGYQTAILAELAQQVYTVERIATLADKAQKVLAQLQYHQIHFLVGDGTSGWAEHAPYDGIIVTSGAPAVPETLVAQLADNGKLVIPVGGLASQVLQIITKQGNRLETTTACKCIFVKLIGQHGWAE